MSYLGSQPIAALMPLYKGQNLSDLPDKAASRANLEVYSKEETLLHTVPIGTILSFWGNSAPAGYLPCYGQVVNSATYPDLVQFLNPGGSSATLPDLRGEFLRGWDAGRGVDSGRAIKSWQKGTLSLADSTSTTPWITSPINADDNQQLNLSRAGLDKASETNYPDTRLGFTTSNVSVSNLSTNPETVGSTRPRNVAVLYCIKAYGAFTNTTTLDVADLAQEIGLMARQTDFLGSKAGNGYQYVNGLLIQWGKELSTVGSTTGKMDVTFPIAFSNTCFMAMGSIGIAHTSYDQTSTGTASTIYRDNKQSVSIGMPTKTGFPAQYFIDNDTGDRRVFQWFAIGY